MARPIWTGSVAFGLVNVLVALYAATEDKTIHFNQFQAGTSDRIRYKRVNERTGREVDLADIVRGYEVSKGDYVLVTDEELEAIDPGRSRTIDIADFVDLAEIDPVYFQKTYYLAPQEEGAMRAYAQNAGRTAAGLPAAARVRRAPGRRAAPSAGRADADGHRAHRST
jgi:DNA end-binding protein Ku